MTKTLHRSLQCILSTCLEQFLIYVLHVNKKKTRVMITLSGYSRKEDKKFLGEFEERPVTLRKILRGVVSCFCFCFLDVQPVFI